MGRKAKVTDNAAVADWLIQNKWLNSLNAGTRQLLPAFVDDSVWAAVAIVAGSSNGKVNISPKLVMKALMLKTISSQEVKRLEVGYEMSDRQSQRLAQTARFALDGIRHRVQEYENNMSEHTKTVWRLEKQFVDDYYRGTKSPLHSESSKPLPEDILKLYKDGKYVEYGKAVSIFRKNITVGV